MTQWIKWAAFLTLAVATSGLVAGQAHADVVVVPNFLASQAGPVFPTTWVSWAFLRSGTSKRSRRRSSPLSAANRN